jgi:hypothetical protein
MAKHMLTLRCLILCLTLSAFLPPAGAQNPGVPPHIERILQKAQAGRNITDQEQAALQKWGESMAKGAQGAVSGSGDGPAGAPGTEEITWPEKATDQGSADQGPHQESLSSTGEGGQQDLW